MVWPGAIERYLSCGETMAAWKSIECIIGAATSWMPGTASSERLVIENLIVSPTRARMIGPGTWSPNVQALNFTPGAISTILCVVSSRMVFTGAGSSGFSAASRLSALPSANAPLWRSAEIFAGTGFRSILETSYGSGAGEGLQPAMKIAVAPPPRSWNTVFIDPPYCCLADRQLGCERPGLAVVREARLEFLDCD